EIRAQTKTRSERAMGRSSATLTPAEADGPKSQNTSGTALIGWQIYSLLGFSACPRSILPGPARSATIGHPSTRYPMINGAHFLLYTPDPEADRAFFRDGLPLPAVDAGEGW